MYDLSCSALVSGRTRASYIASIGEAGASPAELYGGDLTVGGALASADIGDLAPVSTPVGWVQLLHGGSAVAGSARFTNENGTWKYCGYNS